MTKVYNVDYAWRLLINDLVHNGVEREPRGLKTKELLAVSLAIPMAEPLLNLKSRNLGYRFAAAEAAWILDGDNRLATIMPYAQKMGMFSDDGLTLAGAYGPPLKDQLGWAVQALAADDQTRQAVITLWRPRPGPSKDIPCTVSLQWMIRDRKLHCVATMRSSDAWLGLPYDIFTFSCISAYMLTWMLDPVEECNKVSSLGHLYLNLASSHIYEKQWEQAAAAGADPTQAFRPRRIYNAAPWVSEPEKFREHLNLLAQEKWSSLPPDGWLVQEYHELEQARRRQRVAEHVPPPTGTPGPLVDALFGKPSPRKSTSPFMPKDGE